MDNIQMLNRGKMPRNYRIPGYARTLMLVLVTLALLQSACSKKSEPKGVSSAPVRLVLLPFNVPQGDKTLQWTSLAATILMARKGAQAEGLELVPLWETMPFARDNAGTTRLFTPDSAANVASWMSAKWAVLGELTPTKSGVSMIVDFIPSRSNQVAFRYMKRGKIDAVGEGFPEAYSQFLRYLVAKPLSAQTSKTEGTMTSMKSLAEAVDREYGWFVEAQPGKAQEIVAELMNSDDKLARFLFSPSLYPAPAAKK